MRVNKISTNHSNCNTNNNGLHFNGTVDKSTISFLKKTKQKSLLGYITDNAKKLHKDTVIKIKKHTDIYFPTKYSTTTYFMTAENKYMKDKMIIALMGEKEGLFSKIVTPFKYIKSDIKKTIPHLDEIFVQRAKNLNSFTTSECKQTKKTQEIMNFAKDAHVDYKKEVKLSKYPLISKWW